MKVTKHQTQNVRNYLAGIGHEISHVQALEVIARAYGLRSRHVVLKPSPQLMAIMENETRNPLSSTIPECRSAFLMSATLRARYRETDEHPDYPRGDWLFVMSKKETLLRYWDWVATRLESYATDEYLELRSDQIKAAYLSGGCGRRDLDDAVSELLCECSDLFENEDVAMAFLMSEDLPSKVPVSDPMDTIEAIKTKYLASGLSPSDLNNAAEQLMEEKSLQLFDSLFSARLFLMAAVKEQSIHVLCSMVSAANAMKRAYKQAGGTEQALTNAISYLTEHCAAIYKESYSARLFLTDAVPEKDFTEIAKAIKAEYLASSCEASDVDHAVEKLMAICPQLFKDSNAAWEFINDEQHEENGFNYVITVESEAYGSESWGYSSIFERNAGVVRLMSAAIGRKDGIARCYYFSDILLDIERNSPAEEEALKFRTLIAEIDSNTEIYYQGLLVDTVRGLLARPEGVIQVLTKVQKESSQF